MYNVIQFKPKTEAEPTNLEAVMRRNAENKRRIERERAAFIKKNRNKSTFYNKPELT